MCIRDSIYTARHAFDAKERGAGACFAKKVTIGNNVWVGGGVHMDCGITIGDNTVIGAGSVITRDIPANVVCLLYTSGEGTVVSHIFRHDIRCRSGRTAQHNEQSDELLSAEAEFDCNGKEYHI